MKVISTVKNQKIDKDTEEIIASFDYPARTKRLEVAPYGEGGLSDARVYRVIASHTSFAYIIKVGPTDQIEEEYSNYSRFVKGRLRCAVNLERSRVGQRISGLREALLDRHIGYRGLGEHFQLCSTFEDVQRVLDPIFVCLAAWYDQEPSSEEVDIRRLFQDVRDKCKSRWARDYGAYKTVSLKELNLSLFNPLDICQVPSENEKYSTGFRHGDLRFQNVFVNGKGGNPFIIDFATTGHGRILEDFVKLETSVKFELLNCTESEFFRFEEYLSMQRTYEPLPQNDEAVSSNSRLSLAFRTVELIRQNAKRFGRKDGFEAYLYLLLLQSLKFMGYDWATGEERDRAHIASHLLALRLIPRLANYVSPQIQISSSQKKTAFDPYYDTALRLLNEDNRVLTVFQRTPSLLFDPASDTEREFQKALLRFGHSCIDKKQYRFNYVFSAVDSAAKFSSLDDSERSRFKQRLRNLKALEKKTSSEGDSRFRLECIGGDRRVFSPMVLTDNDSAFFLAEDESIPRSRKVIYMGVSKSTHLQTLHDLIKKTTIYPDPQTYDSIIDMLEKEHVGHVDYEIIDKPDAMYIMGSRIARESKRRLIIVQRTPSLVLGAEPLAQGTKNKYDILFMREIKKKIKMALKPGFNFSYLYSEELTRRRYKAVMESNRPQRDKDRFTREINSNLKLLKAREDESLKSTRRGHDYSFRIASVSSNYMGPLALGDSNFAFLFGQIGNKTLVLNVKSKDLTDVVYDKIIQERPSPKTWEVLAREIGSLPPDQASS